MNHGMAYTCPLYSPDAIWPGKKLAVLGWNLPRLASQPGRANVAGQTTSVVITSGVDDCEMKRCCNCCSATSAVGERERICTWILGFACSNALTAAVVAVPSEPRPWVANTIVCEALAGTCFPALEPLLP